MLISAEVRDVFDFSSLEAENETPGEVQAAGFFAPATVVINCVVATLNHNERMRLEVGLPSWPKKARTSSIPRLVPARGW
jgi:hypothetical protein